MTDNQADERYLAYLRRRTAEEIVAAFQAGTGEDPAKWLARQGYDLAIVDGEIRIIPKGPLKSGWMPCPCLCHRMQGDYGYCAECDDLGIVVATPPGKAPK